MQSQFTKMRSNSGYYDLCFDNNDTLEQFTTVNEHQNKEFIRTALLFSPNIFQFISLEHIHKRYSSYIETSELIFKSNPLTSFHMVGFYKFFKKYFVAKGTLELNIS